MQTKNKLLSVFLLSMALLGACTEPFVRKEISIVPRPASLVENTESFLMDETLTIIYSEESLAKAASFLADQVKDMTSISPEVKQGNSIERGAVYLELSTDVSGKESYTFEAGDDHVRIKGLDERGVFYAVQSFLQLIQLSNNQFFVPGVKIEDNPRFAWRGMHLDVSRHFFGVDKIKKYIDYLSMYKLNTFHWHLTDDQGWRIEIKSYPLLTEEGAWRKSVGFASNQAKGLNEDNGEAYGGFYTQKEIKEIVQYALDRQVTIVPEIEMPGHTSAVLKAYPELACEGIGQTELWEEGGVSNHVFCAGKEETFDFLQNVLDEVLTLFPSEYIHIGGDEAPKVHWKQCALCQKRIKSENLADEHELQSYFITRMEEYLNRNGRKLIGWDEILEGGLAPNAAVMSWRGVAGGIAAAQARHEAVMTPGFPLYFNHRPIDLKNSPGHSSSNNTVTTVYNYEPVPRELTEEEAKYVIGVQANLWTEYIPKWKHVESLVFPRLLALSEIAWTSSDRKDFEDFRRRLPHQLERLEQMGVNYGKDPYQVLISMQMKNKKQMVEMDTELPGLTIRYTTNGTQPSEDSKEYLKPWVCTQTSIIKAAAFIDTRQVSEVSTMEFLNHKATAKTVTYEKTYSPKYTAGGDFGLVDGRYGFEESISFGWQGFLGKQIVTTIDLDTSMLVSSISAGFLSDQNQWIFQPDAVSFEVSKDGENFRPVFQKSFENSREEQVVQKVYRPTASKVDQEARYIRLKVTNERPIPEWHGGAGTMPWIFIDEIVVQ